jgi:hypothetical protein
MTSSGAFAIVSPCSTCANQRSTPDPNGGMQNTCPRRVYQSTYVQLQASPDQDDVNTLPSIRHLALTGIKSQDDANNFTGGLVNPVYDDAGNSILTWVAMVVDNDVVYDPASGDIINPSILEGAAVYNTDFIQCKPLPYGPNMNEANLFQSGGLREWESVSVVDSVEQPSLDGFTVESYGGSVQRAILLGQTPRKPTFDHECPDGV